ncbi:solute carrier family 35 member D3 [Notothenia coriiceps]|uniref:Solute carrier family 35 member D3 n=1 Tax=Notothenia coriiceps TaxID=8208 RepID=A0A6I9NEI5_9TELE|nr:PREDICTED: solute carrier family 35 member D3 [Notothenia coriiceps]
MLNHKYVALSYFYMLNRKYAVLLVCSLISLDTVNMWSYEGWKDPHITVIFFCCVFIGCLMNFTTLHCTYINSAVTTSFVGVVKSIATITVGMLAFTDVAPSRLFIGGVAVNTIGSVTYCVVKYFETKKMSLYEDLEEAGKDGALPGEPHQEKPALNGDPGSNPGQTEVDGVLIGHGKTEVVQDGVANGDVWTGNGETEANPHVMTETEMLEMQREHLHKENAAPNPGPSVSDSYLGVWRSIRHLQFMKKEPLIDNMEQQSP